MADAFCANEVSVGFSETEVGSPRCKPGHQLSFDTDEALYGSFGFSTPSRKDSSHTCGGQCFSTPSRKTHLFDSDDIFDSFNTPAKKRLSQSCELGLTPSTAAPTPERGLSLASPWPSPFSSRVSSLEYEMAPFLPNPPDTMLLQSVHCSMDNCLNFGYELLAPPVSTSTPCAGSSDAIQPEVTSLPTTPRNTRRFNTVGDQLPLPSTPRRKQAPALLKALQANSIDMVRDAISDDADVPKLPFFDHNCEPPLCCAVRLCCDHVIVSHLLETRADVNAINVDGVTALDIVRRPAQRRGDDVGSSSSIFAFTSAFPSKNSRDETERLLIAAGGCSSHSPGSTPGDLSCTQMPLPGKHEVACQLDTGRELPTLAPCQHDIEQMRAMLEGLLPPNVDG
eukprot:TRINITY_DN5645_c0_g1_i1.p1 TRINITY_DN5645_c0_g1~~TRINITY_DN5645_c0_g1_i1.p1  ORF type:complete len:395 (+),score=52.86 TRINITY_DN5645_c0_g1_i1:69-1253(+)